MVWPITKYRFKILAVVLSVALFGYISYQVAITPPDRWVDIRLDQDLAEEHCNNDYQCLEDLRVSLSGCIAVHDDDSIEARRDATYFCQYHYMAKLGVRLPVQKKDGEWESGNLNEIQARMNHIANCSKAPILDTKTAEGQAALDTQIKCINSYPNWHG